MENIPQRKTIRLDKGLYQKPDQPFSITICTHNKIPLLNRFRKLIFDAIMKGDLARKSDLMAVCVMPDHVHFLMAPSLGNLIDLIAKWKSYTTHLIWEKGRKGKVWQGSFYDHALRKDEDLPKAAEYIVNNPVRKGLVEDWKNYPYSWYKWVQSG